MARKSYAVSENNPVGHYFGEESATCRIVSTIRNASVNGQLPKINDGIIERAKQEIVQVKIGLDRPTYEIAQDFNDYIFGHAFQRRAIFAIDGYYVGPDSPNLEGIIGIDMKVKPHELFTHDSRSGVTVDAHLTDTKVVEYLKDHRNIFSRDNLDGFRYNASMFFYLKKEEIVRFMVGEQIDMAKLLPFLMWTGGYVNNRVTTVPSKREYMDGVPTFTSVRQKTSLRKKIIRLCAKPGILSRENMIKDWVAYRAVVNTRQKAKDIAYDLSRTDRIGKTYVIEVVEVDDHYEKNGPHNGMNVVLRVRRGKNESVREFQIVDKESYNGSEINPKDHAHRLQYEKKRRITQREKSIDKAFGPILEDMFGRQRVLRSLSY